jgi:hypothetical protein
MAGLQHNHQRELVDSQAGTLDDALEGHPIDDPDDAQDAIGFTQHLLTENSDAHKRPAEGVSW